MNNHPPPSWLNLNLARIAGVLLNPRRYLMPLAHQPGYWLPIVIVAVSLAALRLTMLPVFTEHYNNTQFIERYAAQRSITTDEAERELTVLRRFAPLLLTAEAPVMTVLGVGAVALLLFIVGRLGRLEKVGFRQLFAMVSWASIVGAIPLLLNIPLKFIDPDLELPSNAAFLLPGSLVGGYFHRILQTLDLFLIWQVWLLSIGYAGLFKVSLQRAVGTVGTMFVCFAVLNAMMVTSGV